MFHLRQERFLDGTYSKLKLWKLELFHISKRINNNEYFVDLPTILNISSTSNFFGLYEYHQPNAAQTQELKSSSHGVEGN